MPDFDGAPGRIPYTDLPFNERDSSRSYAAVVEEHEIDFMSLVGDRLSRFGACALLDMACGNSTFSAEIGRQHPGAQLTRVDLYTDEERGYDASNDPPNVTFLQGDCDSALDLPDQSFDLIVTTWGPARYDFGSTDPDLSYITEMARLLKPGGQGFSRPEGKLFAHGFDAIIRNPKYREHTMRKARHYKRITEEGFRVFFHEDPNCARIYAPGGP